ncbi:hypothetical protein [Tenacibaculum sp. C7A-26P2]|uniref:hypothetical protein n=1 Tax=Tenacibaculum sp. C7A-26P2 TaxID=3447504 RepID=UPI003F84F396
MHAAINRVNSIFIKQYELEVIRLKDLDNVETVNVKTAIEHQIDISSYSKLA